MAASLMIFTGRLKADSKLKPTQPFARLRGSAIGRLKRTRRGYPMDTTSYFQSLASFFTVATMDRGDSWGQIRTPVAGSVQWQESSREFRQYQSRARS